MTAATERLTRRCAAVLACIALGIALSCVLASAALAEPSELPFEVLPGSFNVTSSLSQAGAHENLSTHFEFATRRHGERTVNDVRTTVVNLPAGFVGNDTAVPACPASNLLAQVVEKGAECAPESQVGTISFDLTLNAAPVLVKFPIFNVEVTSFGVTAELGFNALIFSQIIPIRVRPGDMGLTAESPNIENIGEIHNITVTIWGVPWAHEHDAERGEQCYPQPTTAATSTCGGGGKSVSGTPKPYLATPTECVETPLQASMKADSWEQPQAESWLLEPVQEVGPLALTAAVAPSTGCERVPFDPSITVQPTTDAVESPSGLNVSLEVPQNWEKAETLATSDLKDATVTLPQGYTVNPSAGSGLAGCTPQQYEAETSSSPPGAGCPPESKLGTVVIETPILGEPVAGNIYLAMPYDNPFHTLLGLYVVAKLPARGVIVKTAGRVEPNPVTGQLTSTFEDTPQQPFSKFTIKFRQGATSPLVSPQLCGTYTTQAQLTPWSAPGEPRSLSNTLQIEDGIGGAPCPSGGAPPFKPSVIAGTADNAAGSYSPFYLRIVRQDGEQEITRFSTTLPPGLSGNLTGIPFCSEADIEAARQASGAQEESDPSCPAASEVGHTTVSAGVGSVLAQTPGRVYLAGPYHGAPLSIVSITSAKVGPFDLGTVVIRFALDINPTTAQVEVSGAGSDPIPHIIDGIVVHVREIRVYMSREKFILNPTSCNPMTISETITGAGANPSDPADQAPVGASAPFQAADCANLAFKPGFGVSTSAQASRANGASLTAKLTMPGALGSHANIAQVKVELPKQMPARLTTLQKACLAKVFETNPAACPAAAVVGHATATTPILPVPLTGPAYFVSHGGEAFPSLIIVLQGYGLTIDLVGSTYISKQGITSSTFKTVPDVPVGSFELTLPQGPYSALAANANLCQGALKMPTEFVAQNGVVLHQSTTIAVAGCRSALDVLRASTKGTEVGVLVRVPSAGRLLASGAGFASAGVRAGKAGSVTVRLGLTKAERALLARHRGRRLRTRVKLLFIPRHGRRVAGSVTVLVK